MGCLTVFQRDGDVGRDHPPYLLQPRMLHTLTPQVNSLTWQVAVERTLNNCYMFIVFKIGNLSMGIVDRYIQCYGLLKQLNEQYPVFSLA